MCYSPITGAGRELCRLNTDRGVHLSQLPVPTATSALGGAKNHMVVMPDRPSTGRELTDGSRLWIGRRALHGDFCGSLCR